MKSKFTLLIILSVFLSIFIFYNVNNSTKNKGLHEEQTTSSSNISKYLESISLDDFEEIKNSQETFFVYVNNDSCSDCQFFNVELSNELQNNKSLHIMKFLDVTTLHSNKQLWNEFKDENMIEGTPSFIFIKSGKIVNTYGWTKDHDVEFKTFLEWFNGNLNNI